jgi:hypothetical protein
LRFFQRHGHRSGCLVDLGAAMIRSAAMKRVGALPPRQSRCVGSCGHAGRRGSSAAARTRRSEPPDHASRRACSALVAEVPVNMRDWRSEFDAPYRDIKTQLVQKQNFDAMMVRVNALSAAPRSKDIAEAITRDIRIGIRCPSLWRFGASLTIQRARTQSCGFCVTSGS